MTREFHKFLCEGDILAGTLNTADGATGLLIVSGGNEIRAGAHSGMSKLAINIAESGFPVFRYDRRGIGDSEGVNTGFLNEAEDIAAAASHFRQLCPQIKKILAFGNCDAATALALFGEQAGMDGYILANPWVIEECSIGDKSSSSSMPASAIRARYLDRLKNPRTLLDLFSGKIDLRKMMGGLKQAARRDETGELAKRLAKALTRIDIPMRILLAKKDTTARAFSSAWQSQAFANVREKSTMHQDTIDSSSHSFADDASRQWLQQHIRNALKNA